MNRYESPYFSDSCNQHKEKRRKTMLSILQTIAERKIQQAMQEGTLLDLSHWKDKPLPPDDMAGVPDDLRMAYRLLKNAGYVPEEIAIQKEIIRTEQLLATCTD